MLAPNPDPSPDKGLRDFLSCSTFPLRILILNIFFVQLVRRLLYLRRTLRNTSLGLCCCRAPALLIRIVHGGGDVLGHRLFVEGSVAVGGLI